MIIRDIDSVETTEVKEKITRKDSESRRHGDSIQQGQSNRNAILKATMRMTNTTTTKNTPSLIRTVNLIYRNRKVSDKKIRMTARLPSLWLKLEIEMTTRIEQQPSLSNLFIDLCFQFCICSYYIKLAINFNAWECEDIIFWKVVKLQLKVFEG